MIKYPVYIKQDVTNIHVGVIVHGCNCQGAMGAGVALAIKKTWPKAYNQYMVECESMKPEDLLGTGLIVKIHEQLYIGNLFTQLTSGNDGKRYASPEAIETSLPEALYAAQRKGLAVYMPRIGCGLGGLNWEADVLPILEKLLDQYSVAIYVCDL